MDTSVDAPVPPGDDPIDAEEPAVLRQEILRLRDLALGEQSRSEVLSHRVTELEQEVHALGAERDTLATELASTPLARVTRKLRSLVRPSGRSS